MKNPAFWIAILAAIFFGASTPLSKPLLSVLTTYQLAGVLYLGACLGVLPMLIRERKLIAPWRLDRKNLLRLLGAVIFGGLFGPLALLAGLRMASAGSVSMWLNLEVFATAILGHFFFRDHLSRKGWLAVGGILLAAFLLVGSEGQAGITAGFLVAVACLFWGLDNHLTALIDGITPAQSTFWKGLVAGTTNLIIGLFLAPFAGSAWHLLGGLTLGVFAYGLSIVLYITSAQQLGATRSQLIFSSAPFWGVLLSGLMLSESYTLQQGAAGVLFIVSIWLLVKEQHEHIHTHQVTWHEHPHTHTDGHHNHQTEEIPGSWHNHCHSHENLAHSHKHQPDLHHRHCHAPGN